MINENVYEQSKQVCFDILAILNKKQLVKKPFSVEVKESYYNHGMSKIYGLDLKMDLHNLANIINHNGSRPLCGGEFPHDVCFGGICCLINKGTKYGDRISIYVFNKGELEGLVPFENKDDYDEMMSVCANDLVSAAIDYYNDLCDKNKLDDYKLVA